MKLTTLLLFVAIIQIQASTYSQNTKISLDVKNKSVEYVLEKIESLSEFKFFVDTKQVDLQRTISIKEDKQRISKILKKIFNSTNVTFEVFDKQIVLKLEDKVEEIEEEPIVIIEKEEIQEVEISGLVTDKEGTPLPGVNIVIEGTTKGTDTDFDGNYTINAPKGAVLVFSYMGMITQKLTVGNSTEINVSLLDEPNKLNEVVVVGYGTQKKENLSGAVRQVSAMDLEDRVVTDPVKALQGAIPGLNITYSTGKIDATPDINIRGFESLSGGSPLIVIDGVPASVDQFTELNPNDIESVSTLMDAASASIYGARAAFGVVLVTTKGASNTKLQVTFGSNISMKTPINIPEFELDPYLVMQQRQEGAGGWYTLVNDWDLLKQMSEDGTEVMVDPANPDYYLYAGRTNWYEEAIKKNSLTTNYNMSLSGRSEKVGYYLSAGYSNAEGVFNYGNDDFDKYNMRMKLDFQVTDWLNIANNTSYNADEYDQPSQGFNFAGLYDYSTTGIIKNPDGSWTEDAAWIFGAASEGGRWKTSNSRFSTSFTAKANFWDDLLKVTAKASFMRGDMGLNAHFLPVEFKEGPEVGGTYNPLSSAQRESTSNRQNVFDLYADVDKSFGDHKLHLLVGFNQEYRNTDWFKASRKDLISYNIPSIELATGDRIVGEDITDWTTRSGFFRFNYDYKNKYLIEFNGRYDGTSRFPKDDRFGFFPSVSVGWNVTKEDFFKGGLADQISTLKPRFSYGSLGNQDVGAYAYLPTMSSGTTSSIVSGGTHDQQTTLYAPGLVSGSLTWEKVQTTNIGLDFGFFKNRLTGVFNYYHRSTLDMLTKSKQLPGVLGTSEPQENAADLITKGWDLSLAWRDGFDISGSRFNYNLGVILADSRTWITDFDNPNGNISDYYKGYEIGTIWGFEVDGLFQTPEELANHANQSSFWSYPDKVQPGPGDIKFNDLNGDGNIRIAQTVNDTQDQKIIGNTSSRYTLGFRSGANWKGFDLGMFWQGVMKRDIYPTSRIFWGLRSSPWTNLQTYNYNNSWTPETTDGYMPRIKGYAASTWSGAEMLQPNTRYLQNAWYMRMKNLTLGYTLPENWSEKAKISKLRFYVTGENLVTFGGVKNPNLDPETLSGSYPVQKLFAVGLTLKF